MKVNFVIKSESFWWYLLEGSVKHQLEPKSKCKKVDARMELDYTRELSSVLRLISGHNQGCAEPL